MGRAASRFRIIAASGPLVSKRRGDRAGVFTSFPIVIGVVGPTNLDRP